MWTATDSVDLQTLFGKSSLENNIAWLIIAIWKGSIEFSPLTRVYFESRIKSHRLGKYNSWNSGSWGCSDLGSNPEDRCDLPEALRARRDMHLCHWKLACIVMFHISPLVWLSPVTCSQSPSLPSCLSPWLYFIQQSGGFKSSSVHSYQPLSCTHSTPCPIQ